MSLLSFDKIIRIISVILNILVSALKMVNPSVNVDPESVDE